MSICHDPLHTPILTSGGPFGRPRRVTLAAPRRLSCSRSSRSRSRSWRAHVAGGGFNAPGGGGLWSPVRSHPRASRKARGKRPRGRRSCTRRGRRRFESIQMVLVRRRVIFFIFFSEFGSEKKAPWPLSGLQGGRGKGGGG